LQGFFSDEKAAKLTSITIKRPEKRLSKQMFY